MATFLEFAEFPIKKESINNGWIEGCFGRGKEGLLAPSPATRAGGRIVRDNAISCSGTSMGTIAGMRRYLDTMLAEIKKKQCKSYGIDQGYHNFLLHSGRLGGEERTRRYPQGTGPINTVGLISDAALPLPRDRQGFVLNRDGSRSAVVHQWDRFWQEFIIDGWLEQYSAPSVEPSFNRCTAF